MAFGLRAVPREHTPRLALDFSVVKYSTVQSLNFTHCCVIYKKINHYFIKPSVV